MLLEFRNWKAAIKAAMRTCMGDMLGAKKRGVITARLR